MSLRKILSIVISVGVIYQPAYAQSNPALLTSTEEDIYRSRISEYFYMRSNRDILKPVRLLGNVRSPGLYHVPANTTLTNLLALSGGPNDEADTKKIVVTRKDGSVEKRDLMKLVTKNQDVTLGDGDIVFVPKEEYFINQKSATIILAIATIVSVSLSTYVVFKND